MVIATHNPGKLAEMVIVVGDPSVDIRVLLDPARFVTVIKGGEVVSGQLPVPQRAMAAE